MRLIFFTMLCIALAIPAWATKPDTTQTDIQTAQDYLNALDTGQARFVQTTHDGGQLIGTFYINRPGKLRFEYDDPIEDFVVSDGYFIYFYDAELGEQTNMPLGQSLADFLLRKDIDLNDDVIVDEVKRGGELLQIKLVQEDDPEAGSLTLGFREDPFALKKWRVTDPQGLITEVELFYLKTGIDLDDDLFIYQNPKGRGGLNE